MSLYRTAGKRIVDITASLAALIILSPIMAIIAVAIHCDDGGRIIFRQRRIGRNGSSFWLFKFRSLPEHTGDIPSHMAATIQPTRIGTLIRRTNLDELPQLVNILRGDMSLVGPRPALPSQEDLLHLRRDNGALACLPGLTGLAQVSAYTGMSVYDKAAWDAQYAQRVTLMRDLGIIVRTIRYLASPPPIY